MVLDLARFAGRYADMTGVLKVSNLTGLQDAMAVQQQVWGGDLSAQLAHLARAMTHTPDDISVYVIYDQGQPVASAWIVYNGTSPFAGIWGGSTVEAYRGRGCYSALLYRRIDDA